MARLPAQEKEALLKLWLKLDTQGLETLSSAERGELRAFFQRLDSLSKSPIIEAVAKREVRRLARLRFWNNLWKQNPDLARQLLGSCEVHHRWPIEYAHLAPELDINGSSEIVAVSENVHDEISIVWNEVRKSKQRLTASEVGDVVSMIDRHFQHWYNTPATAVPAKATIKTATSMALMEVQKLLASR